MLYDIKFNTNFSIPEVEVTTKFTMSGMSVSQDKGLPRAVIQLAETNPTTMVIIKLSFVLGEFSTFVCVHVHNFVVSLTSTLQTTDYKTTDSVFRAVIQLVFSNVFGFCQNISAEQDK